MNESLSRGLEERQFRIQRARDCLEKTQELFDHFGSAELKSAHARFEELKRGLESDRVQLAVLGEFSRGKSELLNALLGIELLWVANDATTAVNTFLHALSPGRDERFILIHYQDGRPAEEIAWSDDEALKRWGTELDATNAEARLEVSKIEIFLDHELLNKGLILIDTPGFQSMARHHEEITRNAIAEAHVAIWVQDAGQLGGTKSEWDFMSRTLLRSFQKFVTVINKWDLVLEPQDSHDKKLGEQERIGNKLKVVKNNLAKILGDSHGEKIARLTSPDHLFGVSARWGRDPDPERRRRSGIDRLAQRIAEMVTSGEAQAQIILKPLTQLADIQSQLADYIDSELRQLDADTSAEARAQELQRLELDIRELKQDEDRETAESREEHARAARVLVETIRAELLKPLIILRDSIEDQVTESYVRRMFANKVGKIGLPDELDRQFQTVANQVDTTWQKHKRGMKETLDGLRARYVQAMEKHARQIESNLGEMNIRLPALDISLDFDFSALEDHRRRSAQLNEEMERLNDEIDSLDTEIARNAIDEQQRQRAEAALTRAQRQLESMGPPPAPVIYEETRRSSDWGSGFLWLSPTYETVTRTDDSNVTLYKSERSAARDTIREREEALKAFQEEEFQRTERRMNLEAARKKFGQKMAKTEKEARATEQQTRQDENALIQDALKQLLHNTAARLNETVGAIETYLSENLNQVFMDQARMLVGCVQEQMLEPLNAKRAQQQEIQTLLQQDQAQIEARRAELAAGRQALAEVQDLTQTALNA